VYSRHENDSYALRIAGWLEFDRYEPFVPLCRKVLDLLEIQDRCSPSRTIVARLRSLAGNIIALATAERSFIMP